MASSEKAWRVELDKIFRGRETVSKEEFASYCWERRIDGNRVRLADDRKTRVGSPYEQAHCADLVIFSLMEAGLLHWQDFRAGLLARWRVEDWLREVGSRQQQLDEQYAEVQRQQAERDKPAMQRQLDALCAEVAEMRSRGN